MNGSRLATGTIGHRHGSVRAGSGTTLQPRKIPSAPGSNPGCPQFKIKMTRSVKTMEAIYIKGPDGEPEYDGMHMDGYELELWEARQERGRMRRNWPTCR